MMRPFLTTFVILSSLTSSGALACGCGSHAVTSTVLEDGTAVGLVLSSEQMWATPSWSPTQEEPPLSVSEAAGIAQVWAESVFTRYDSVEIASIELDRYRCRSPDDPDQLPRWYYKFKFWPVIDGNRLYGGGNFAAILMDGTVIEPQKVNRISP